MFFFAFDGPPASFFTSLYTVLDGCLATLSLMVFKTLFSQGKNGFLLQTKQYLCQCLCDTATSINYSTQLLTGQEAILWTYTSMHDFSLN